MGGACTVTLASVCATITGAPGAGRRNSLLPSGKPPRKLRFAAFIDIDAGDHYDRSGGVAYHPSTIDMSGAAGFFMPTM